MTPLPVPPRPDRLLGNLDDGELAVMADALHKHTTPPNSRADFDRQSILAATLLEILARRTDVVREAEQILDL